MHHQGFEMFKEGVKLMILEKYGITVVDEDFWPDELEGSYKDGDEPADFANQWGAKNDLEEFSEPKKAMLAQLRLQTGRAR